MNSIISFLSGKKTYLLGICGLLYAVGGYFSGHIDQQTALDAVWASLSLMGLRAGVAKIGQ